MSAMVSFERLFEVLDLEPMIKESPDAVVIPDGPAELVFDHVDFSYPGAEEVSLASLEAVARLDDTPRTDVLHDVTFRVEPGTMTALVGHSGAGKTTISMLVSRLYDVDGGGVTINGVDVRNATTASLNAMVGVVTQDPHLFHDTLRANLIFARPAATARDRSGAARRPDLGVGADRCRSGSRRSWASAAIDSAAARSSASRWRGSCSRRRDSSCWTKRPRTSTTRVKPRCSARSIETMSSRTSLVIAHRLSTIRNADQILVVENGTIVQRGSHAELLAEGGVYRVLYETQFADQED
jgi:ATP-binding cassette, subfamily B, bacterial